MREKYYGVFRKNKKIGLIEGYVEHSFSMGWSSSEVLVYKNFYDTRGYYNVQKDFFHINNLKDKEYTYFIKRLSKRDNKFKFDFKYWFYNKKLYLKGVGGRKYFIRNIKFRTMPC